MTVHSFTKKNRLFEREFQILMFTIVNTRANVLAIIKQNDVVLIFFMCAITLFFEVALNDF